MNRRFAAKSPKTGNMRNWEVVQGIGSYDPDEFITCDNDSLEAYSKGQSGYEDLLKAFRET